MQEKAGFRNPESCPNLIGKLQPYDLAHRQECACPRAANCVPTEPSAPPLTPALAGTWTGEQPAQSEPEVEPEAATMQVPSQSLHQLAWHEVCAGPGEGGIGLRPGDAGEGLRGLCGGGHCEEGGHLGFFLAAVWNGGNTITIGLNLKMPAPTDKL